MKLIKFNIKPLILFSLATLISVIPAAAQRRIPASHEAQHTDLLANQRPASASFNMHMTDKMNDRIKNLESKEALDEIYENYWKSESVNPYGNIEIPMTQDIDVSKGVVPIRSYVSSEYGWRPRFGRMHRGVDIHLNVGDTIVSAFPGKVRLTKYEGKGYGYYVVVRHDNGMETVYGHLSKFLVKPNQRVEAGEPIALGGNTGRSTGPHLHFETRYLGLAVNPRLIFDFEHYTTIKDVYTFDKQAYQKAQVTNGPKASSKSYASKSSKKKGKSRRR